MRDFEALAAAYFRDFESYRLHVGLLNWRSFSLVAALSIFIFGFISSLKSNASLPLIATELLLLGMWAQVQSYQRTQVMCRLNARWGTNYTAVSQLQSEWLKRSIAAPATEYFKIARELSESEKLYKQHRTKFTIERTELFRLVFDPESKARVLSLVIFLLSFLTLLLLRAYDSGQVPVEILWSDDFPNYISFVIFLAFLLWLLLVGVRVSYDFISSFALGVRDAISPANTSSRRAKDHLIQALLSNHEIPKIRYKVNTQHE
ncbi:hypothetical protein ATO7_06155 [Oceanococcus atlanticus]|uniref:Uncharacterized protein n=1 Tax=Oceanococcus atlanticus TaxID=1317117 RepID=A0A1Y1SJ54_9GAMM|nr:hypothetical protein [Oceanococcus atlanticus]ORE89440.1 hypothetical protein ATO7_06155 [Oceanococcus atlanticus]